MAQSALQTRRAPKSSSDGRSMLWLVFSGLLILRIVNALTVQTFFQPDEYYQSLEPAWAIALGQGSEAWITWEWRERLRSAIHPWLFAAVYRLADTVSQALGHNTSTRADNLVVAPKLAQAVCAALMDFYTWKLARVVYGSRGSHHWAALALSIFSPWQWHCSTRTFSNSLETTLTVYALSVWPWQWFFEAAPIQEADTSTKGDRTAIDLKDLLQGKEPARETIGAKKQQDKLTSPSPPPAAPLTPQVRSALPSSLIAAALACILRPTNIFIWTTIAVLMLLSYRNAGTRAALLQSSFIAGSSVLIISLAVDWSYYGTLTLPAYNFVYFNVVRNLASFYGSNRIDYYFTEGLPLLLTTALPFAVIGLWQSLRPGYDRPQFAGFVERQARYVLAVTAMITLLAFSMIGHKEVRFIYPLLPILHVLAAKPLVSFFTPFPIPSSKLRLGVLVFGLTINIYIAAYVALLHQRGVIDVMHYLRHEVELPSRIRNTTVGFLMPCHSVPWRSYLVYPEIDAWALTCEPPLTLDFEQRMHYLDEADVFYSHPGGWLDDNMADRRSVMQSAATRVMAKTDTTLKAWPEYLVFFEHLEPVMNAVLEDTRYRECWRGFNTHWHDDNRRRGDVIVQCLR
ncbi:glycosylphosphatidylinositol anchor biosynthesis [Oleoguttula sp. CCFEE 5521]